MSKYKWYRKWKGGFWVLWDNSAHDITDSWIHYSLDMSAFFEVGIGERCKIIEDYT